MRPQRRCANRVGLNRIFKEKNKQNASEIELLHPTNKMSIRERAANLSRRKTGADDQDGQPRSSQNCDDPRT